jgi:hypothetical protein
MRKSKDHEDGESVGVAVVPPQGGRLADEKGVASLAGTSFSNSPPITRSTVSDERSSGTNSADATCPITTLAHD